MGLSVKGGREGKRERRERDDRLRALCPLRSHNVAVLREVPATKNLRGKAPLVKVVWTPHADGERPVRVCERE